MKWDHVVNCAWHKPAMAIVHVRTGREIPLEAIAKAPDCNGKKLVSESHGICYQCAKTNFPNMNHAVLLENMMDGQSAQ